MRTPRLVSLTSLLLLAACSAPEPPAERTPPGTDLDPGEEQVETLVARAGAPLFDGMGNYHRTISDEGRRLAALFRSGNGARVRLQPCRSDPLVPRGAEAR